MTKELAIKSRLDKKICLECGAVNSSRADKCRKCHSKKLRRKAKEPRR